MQPTRLHEIEEKNVVCELYLSFFPIMEPMGVYIAQNVITHPPLPKYCEKFRIQERNFELDYSTYLLGLYRILIGRISGQ